MFHFSGISSYLASFAIFGCRLRLALRHEGATPRAHIYHISLLVRVALCYSVALSARELITFSLLFHWLVCFGRRALLLVPVVTAPDE